MIDSNRSLALFLLGCGLTALAAGCGLDSPPVSNAPVIRNLLSERSYTQGDLEINEALSTTNFDVGTVYHLRARVLNRGADLPSARFEMLFVPEFWTESVVGRPAELTTGEVRVVATQELGTLFGGQSAPVALEARQYGTQRVRVAGRVASGS